MKGLQQYLDSHRTLRFRLREWDCAKFAALWINCISPTAAHKLAKLLVEAGYNDVEPGDEAGMKKVYATFGCKKPRELAEFFATKFPEHVELPMLPAPGDIAIREEGLSFGIVDEDYSGLFLRKPTGYQRKYLGDEDAFLRVRDA